MDHKLCLSVGHFEASHYGFKTDANPNINGHEWRAGSGTCDCDCGTCIAVHGKDAKEFYLYKFTSTGKMVVKVTIIADGTEGIA